MKKVIYIFAALAALVACNKAETDTKAPKDGLVLNPVSSLTVSSASVTKTSTNSSLQVLWTAGDKIAVYSNKREATEIATPFTLTGAAGGTTATFTSETALDCAEYGVAVYPYTESDDRNRRMLTGGDVYTWISKEQHYVPNSIPTDAYVMASRFDPKVGEMTFTALASVLEVKLYGDISVTNIKVEEYSDATTLGGKNLSGRTKITFDEAGVPSAVTTESSLLNLVCDTPVALGASAENATSFFIVLGGKSSFHHLELTISDSEGKSRTLKVGGEGTTTLAPGTVYSLPPKEVKKIEATVLAGWTLDSAFGQTELGGLYIGTDPVAQSASGNCAASTGTGYIQFKNNDYNDPNAGAGSSFRTNTSTTPAVPSTHICFIPVSNGDEIILAATGCNLAAGDEIQLQCLLWAYASKTNLSKANTCKAYELYYSLNGTSWTKLQEYEFANNTTNPVTSAAGATADISETITLTSAATQILFRFLATGDNAAGTAGGAITASGQTRLSYGSEGQLAILKL